MAYNRWLSSNYLEHHGVKGQQWGVTNGPPYPLDSSKSDGHKLIKGDGSPQGKKKYTSSQKTAHKRALRRSRAEATSEIEEAKRLLPKGDSVRSKIRKFAFVGPDGKLNAEGRKYYNVNGDGSLIFDELELRKEAVKNNNWDTFDKYLTMAEGLNTLKLPKVDKAKKEKQLLSLWYKEQMTDREGAIVNALYRRIAKESGSWYQGESVTDSFRKALEKERAARKNWRKDGYSKESASKVRTARRELSKAVLRDLGFETNSDNIELIEGWIIDD